MKDLQITKVWYPVQKNDYRTKYNEYILSDTAKKYWHENTFQENKSSGSE